MLIISTLYMSVYSNVTQEGLSNSRKLVEEQKIQRTHKIKSRILKPTHDIQLAESLSPVTKKLDEVIESTKKLGEIVKKSDVEDENTQTPAIQNIIGTQSLRDTLAMLKGSKNFFKSDKKSNGDVFWNDVFIRPLRENRISIKDVEYDITHDIQAYFTNTKLTSKFLDNVEKETVFGLLENVGFCDKILEKGLKSARLKDALYNLPKTIAKIRNHTLPELENIEDVADDLQAEGVKIIIPSNINDIYTRLELLLGLEMSGHTDTRTKASNLTDEFFKRGQIQNEQQYRNAPNKFHT